MTEKTKDTRAKGVVKKKSSWEPVKVLIDKDTKIASRVSRLQLKPHPQYTYEIGFVDEEGRFKRFLRPKVIISPEGVVDLEAINAEAVTRVMEEAEVYIVGEVQKREDELQLQAKSRAPRKAATAAKHPSS